MNWRGKLPRVTLKRLVLVAACVALACWMLYRWVPAFPHSWVMWIPVGWAAFTAFVVMSGLAYFGTSNDAAPPRGYFARPSDDVRPKVKRAAVGWF